MGPGLHCGRPAGHRQREGEFTTSRQIGDRLRRELETNVVLRVEENGIGFTVSGRGELHLSVLIETMRREGFEFEVGRPQVVTITEDGVEKEPIEELQIEISSEFIGAISQELGARHAEMKSQETTASSTRSIPTSLRYSLNRPCSSVHLHFEVRVGSTVKNPLDYLKR